MARHSLRRATTALALAVLVLAVVIGITGWRVVRTERECVRLIASAIEETAPARGGGLYSRSGSIYRGRNLLAQPRRSHC